MSEQEPSAVDPQELARQFQAFAEQSQRIFQGFLERQAAGEGINSFDPSAVARSFWEWNAKLMSDPGGVAEAYSAYWTDMSKLMQASAKRLAGQEAEPVVTPERGDRRFKDAAWDEEVVFDHLKQSYLISSQFAQSLVDRADGLEKHTRDLVGFYTQRFIETISPSNFAHSNPAAIRKARETGGQSLIDGFANLLRDLERGKGQLKITMNEPDAFELGKDLATTEGAVVFQNDLIQLIQYAPTTEKVYARPLLIVPPWINKYYALDLTAEKSLVKWLVDQGYSVFLISWVNPGPELAQKGFDDYMFEGPLAALDVVCDITGVKDVNIAGYCIGGTLTATTLAYMAAEGDTRLHSATLIACLTDFEDAGELSVFIDDDQLATLKRTVDARGYHSGEEMAAVFSMMRANDLIWGYVVNNYLMAGDNLPFDMVFWFQDATRLPAKMIYGYLNDYYNKNMLVQPGALQFGGEKLDLGKVATPVYFLATDEDHISPWASSYKGTQLLKGTTDFVLAGSGHNAGVVNPPTKTKYGYRTNSELPDTAEGWLSGGESHEGSWWPHWNAWLKKKSGRKSTAPRVPGEGGHPIIEPAPGSYVKVR